MQKQEYNAENDIYQHRQHMKRLYARADNAGDLPHVKLISIAAREEHNSAETALTPKYSSYYKSYKVYDSINPSRVHIKV